MWTINSIMGKIFEVLFIPFRSMNPWIGMIIVSFLTGLLMLLIFRFTSNQTGIKSTKEKIKAHLLEMRLYSDNMRISLKAQGNILLANLRYIGHSAKPMLVMIIPVLLILIQLNFWFGYASLEPGQPVLLKLKLEENYNPLETDVRLNTPESIVQETPPLRIEEENEIDWRLSARKKGVFSLDILINEETITKSVAVSQRPLSPLSPLKLKGNFFDELLYPKEAPIKKQSPVKSIEIQYPSQSLRLLGLNIHWLIAFFGLSIIFGFSFKGLFGVEI